MSSLQTQTEMQTQTQTQMQTETQIQDLESFEDANFKENLLRGIYSYGWEKPSRIQQQGIPAILTGSDVIMQAQSGMGKTGTFTTALLQLIEEDKPEIQGCILLPTRELADQVYKVIQTIGDYMEINFIKCIGQSRVQNNLAYPKRATILIGTPGKLQAILSKNLLNSQSYNLKCLIIDEFDKMLGEPDFITTIKDIFNHLSENTQVVLSSATVTDEVIELTNQFMKDPIRISIRDDEVSLEGIQQYYINTEKEEYKFDTVLDIYKTVIVAQCILFVNSKRKCDELEWKFKQNDFTVKSIHGGLEQQQRDLIMEEFRQSKIRVLISTDLTARGIDVAGVSLVVNYELPTDKAQYIHRIGRTGRYGKKGWAINLIGSTSEKNMLNAIENHYSKAIQELPSNYASLIS
jgi:translation initiation factor 4A